jgi:hypothetical protein
MTQAQKRRAEVSAVRGGDEIVDYSVGIYARVRQGHIESISKVGQRCGRADRPLIECAQEFDRVARGARQYFCNIGH